MGHLRVKVAKLQGRTCSILQVQAGEIKLIGQVKTWRVRHIEFLPKGFHKITKTFHFKPRIFGFERTSFRRDVANLKKNLKVIGSNLWKDNSMQLLEKKKK